MVETMVGGVVIFDYDLDGDEDVFFVDGGRLPGYEGEAPSPRLFRNETSQTASRSARFVDVTAESGISFDGYGCGASAGDVDGDGDVDLYLTAFGKDALFVNQGNGSFQRSSSELGGAATSWSASSVFFDADRDGDLDLFVASYVDYDLESSKFCGDEEQDIRGYCHPDVFEGVADRLYLNRGDGTFDRAVDLGLESAKEAGLGVVAGDLDDDGWPDLYIANDLDPNILLRNLGTDDQGRFLGFEDLSLLSGTGYSNFGRPEAGMGVEIADLDNDGRLDLYVTNFALETNAFYRNQGQAIFVDRRLAAGLGEPSLDALGFGVAAADFDTDGDLDLVIANGHILDNAAELSAVKAYEQRNQLMENLGGGMFREVLESGLDVVRVSRGLAVGDLDLDGAEDVVIVNSNQRSEVYRNLKRGPFVRVDVRRSSGAVDVGARVHLGSSSDESGSDRQMREVRTGASYLSQSSTTLHFGVDEEGDGPDLSITWVDGRRRTVRNAPSGMRLLVR